MAQTNTEMMRKLYEAFAKGDVPTVLGALSPEVDWRESMAAGHPTGGHFNNPGAVLEGVFMNIASRFDEFSVTPTEFVEQGDKVVVIGQHHFKGKGNSKSFYAPFAHVVTIQDGKITRFLTFEDSAMMIEAVS